MTGKIPWECGNLNWAHYYDESRMIHLYSAMAAACVFSMRRWETRIACKAAGIEYRGEHVFRHTFATNCYHKGIDVKILSKLLGHADVNITYNLYIHLYGDGFEELYSALVN